MVYLCRRAKKELGLKSTSLSYIHWYINCGRVVAQEWVEVASWWYLYGPEQSPVWGGIGIILSRTDDGALELPNNGTPIVTFATIIRIIDVEPNDYHVYSISYKPTGWPSMITPCWMPSWWSRASFNSVTRHPTGLSIGMVLGDTLNGMYCNDPRCHSDGLLSGLGAPTFDKHIPGPRWRFIMHISVCCSRTLFLGDR